MRIILYRGNLHELRAMVGSKDPVLLDRVIAVLDEALTVSQPGDAARVMEWARQLISTGVLYPTDQSRQSGQATADTNLVLAALAELSEHFSPIGGELRASSLLYLADRIRVAQRDAQLPEMLTLLVSGRRIDSSMERETVTGRATCGYLIAAELPHFTAELRTLLAEADSPMGQLIQGENLRETVGQLLAAASKVARDGLDLFAFGS